MEEIFVVILIVLTLLLIAYFFWRFGCFSLQKCKPPKLICCCPKIPPPVGETLYLAQGTLSSAQILTLFSDPPILVPAVSGKVISFVSGFLRMFPGETPYAGANDGVGLSPIPGDSNAPIADMEKSDFFASPTILVANFADLLGFSPDTTGLPLYLVLFALADLTDGDGTCQYFVWYTLGST